MTRSARSFALLLGLSSIAACDETETGFHPVGRDEASPLVEERFVRRLFIDLTGKNPDAGALEAALLRLRDEGDTAAVRGAIASELIASPAFAELTVSELEVDAFGGTGAADAFYLICPAFVVGDPACAHCPIDYGDPCGCDCPSIEVFEAERVSFVSAPADLLAGTSTQEIERRYARSEAFRLNGGSGEGIAGLLYASFLGRPPEQSEIDNVAVCSLATDIQGMGCLIFHQVAHSFAELVDIAFASEVYREAVIRRAFLRYLGRDPSPQELAHFVDALGAGPVDARALVVSLVSSAEYFSQ